MSVKLAILIILSCTFIGSFMISTMILDQICKANGYYEEGINDLKSAYE